MRWRRAREHAVLLVPRDLSARHMPLPPLTTPSVDPHDFRLWQAVFRTSALCVYGHGPNRHRAVPYAPQSARGQRGGRLRGAAGRVRWSRSRDFCDLRAVRVVHGVSAYVSDLGRLGRPTVSLECTQVCWNGW